MDYKDANRIKELLPRTSSSLVKMEDIANACISIWGMPKFFDERRKQGSEAFWLSIIPDKKERENTLSARNYAGMDNEARNFRQGEKILVVTDRAIREALQNNRQDVILVRQMGARVGINPSFMEDFMGKIYVCHSFSSPGSSIELNSFLHSSIIFESISMISLSLL